MGHQSPGHGQHLLLAAGEGARNLLAPLLQPGEVIEYHLQVLSGNLFIDVSAHFQVLLDGHLLENPPSLGDVSQTGAQQLKGLGVGDVLVTEVNGAAAGVHQTGNGFQNGGFSRAVGTDQSHNFALAHLKGHALYRMDGAVIDVHVFNFQHLHGSPPCQGRLQ